MSLSDLMQEHVTSVFLQEGQFAEDVAYNPAAGGDPIPLRAVCKDGSELGDGGGLDTEFKSGRMLKMVTVRVSVAELPSPLFNDTITRGTETLRVRQVERHGAMWLLSCTSNERGGGR